MSRRPAGGTLLVLGLAGEVSLCKSGNWFSKTNRVSLHAMTLLSRTHTRIGVALGRLSGSGCRSLAGWSSLIFVRQLIDVNSNSNNSNSNSNNSNSNS